MYFKEYLNLEKAMIFVREMRKKHKECKDHISVIGLNKKYDVDFESTATELLFFAEHYYNNYNVYSRNVLTEKQSR